MAEIVPAPTRIPVPGGKTIDEYVGRVATGDVAASVAVMTAPPGWSEPAQQPAFDEFTVVLAGSLVVRTDEGPLAVAAGQAVLTRAGEWVQYSVGPDGAHYVAVCLQAFDVSLAHRDPE
jgi:quercetin dioxygenase-like cupin family protein